MQGRSIFLTFVEQRMCVYQAIQQSSSITKYKHQLYSYAIRHNNYMFYIKKQR